MSEKPFNTGPPLELLRQTFVTPNDLFFVRNHGSVPEIDPARYRLSVGGMVKQRLTLSSDEIRDRFPKVTLIATLQCAGNRRRELTAIGPIPGEIPWDADAIGNAVWGGARLREVLREAGPEAEARDVAFAGLDEVEKQGRTYGFGGSISLEKAMNPEVLLAYEMNGEPLASVHGFPLRVVVPGYIGARSVKWLADITVQAGPSTNYFQTHAYKLFPPDVRMETAEWAKGKTLGELPVNAVTCQPQEGETIPGGLVPVRGYALAGGGRRIERVHVSFDGDLSLSDRRCAAAVRRDGRGNTVHHPGSVLDADAPGRRLHRRPLRATRRLLLHRGDGAGGQPGGVCCSRPPAAGAR